MQLRCQSNVSSWQAAQICSNCVFWVAHLSPKAHVWFCQRNQWNKQFFYRNSNLQCPPKKLSYSNLYELYNFEWRNFRGQPINCEAQIRSKWWYTSHQSTLSFWSTGGESGVMLKFVENVSFFVGHLLPKATIYFVNERIEKLNKYDDMVQSSLNTNFYDKTFGLDKCVDNFLFMKCSISYLPWIFMSLLFD